MRPPEVDSQLGMEEYGTSTRGIGGRLRQRFEDFVVEEELKDGTKATVKEIPFPEDTHLKGGFLLCILQKKGVDTFSAVRTVAKRLGIPMERLNFAGLKDADAWTGQVISIQRLRMHDLEDVSFRNFKVRPLCFSNMPVTSRLLLGNSFNVTIRDVTLPRDELAARIGEYRKAAAGLGGFPNYFGYQRFGGSRPITHLVGRYIVKDDLERSTMILLEKAGNMESPASTMARARLEETGDFEEAWRLFPRHLWVERAVINHLRRYPRDFANALRRIPRRLLRLTVQAYQSYLFNRMLSRRISSGFSLAQPELGDSAAEAGDEKMVKPIGTGQPHKETDKFREGKLNLVIPLVGYESRLSEGPQGVLEREILSEEGISPESFRVKRIPEASVRGRFRRMITSPRGLYFDVDEDEINADRMRVTVRFGLKKGCYATVMLREIMKPGDPLAVGF